MKTSSPRFEVPVLLGTQTLFNIGFYAVVPFLAIVLTNDFLLAGTAVGLILGIRAFAQQGLFLAGGILADRFGARSVILIGCAVRASGFITLSASLWTGAPTLWMFILGTLLTGFGGALFSPGLNILVAAAQVARENNQHSKAKQSTLFAWLSITGEIGAVTGPLVGAALWGWGFCHRCRFWVRILCAHWFVSSNCFASAHLCGSSATGRTSDASKQDEFSRAACAGV